MVRMGTWAWRRRRDGYSMTGLRKRLALDMTVLIVAMTLAIVRANNASGSTEVLLIFIAVGLGLTIVHRGTLLVSSWVLKDKPEL